MKNIIEGKKQLRRGVRSWWEKRRKSE
jgi:hypothetical protein